MAANLYFANLRMNISHSCLANKLILFGISTFKHPISPITSPLTGNAYVIHFISNLDLSIIDNTNNIIKLPVLLRTRKVPIRKIFQAAEDIFTATAVMEIHNPIKVASWTLIREFLIWVDVPRQRG